MRRRRNPALPTSAARLLEQDKAAIAAEEVARAESCSTVEARKAAAAAARRCRSEAKRRTAERVSKRRAQLRAEFPRKVDKRAAGRARLSAAQLRQRSRAGEHTAEQRAQLLEDAAGYVDEADREPFLWWARRKVATGKGWRADRYEKLAEDFGADRDAIVSRWVSTVEGGADPEWEAGALWSIARDLVDVHPDELGPWLEGFRVDDAPGLRRELEGLGLPVGRMLAKERKAIMRRANPATKKRAPKKKAAPKEGARVVRRKNPGIVEQLKAKFAASKGPKEAANGAGFLAQRGPHANEVARREFTRLWWEAADLDETALEIGKIHERLLAAGADRDAAKSKIEKARRLIYDAIGLITAWEFEAFGKGSELGEDLIGQRARARKRRS